MTRTSVGVQIRTTNRKMVASRFYMLMILLVNALIYRCGNAQTVEATDTSMVMQVDGVSLTLKSTGCGTGTENRSGSISAVASMFDVQHATDTLVALVQPQVCLYS